MRPLTSTQVQDYLRSIGAPRSLIIAAGAPRPGARVRRRVPQPTRRLGDFYQYQQPFQHDDSDTYPSQDPNVWPQDSAEYDLPIVFNPTGDDGGLAPAVITPSGVVAPPSSVATLAPNPVTQFAVNLHRAAVYTFANTFALNANQQRSSLLFQNQDAVGNLWVNFGQPAAIGLGLELTPGLGFIWDIVTPADNVYALQTSGKAFCIETSWKQPGNSN